MTLLDADDSPLMNSRGEVAARDICNFIAMNVGRDAVGGKGGGCGRCALTCNLFDLGVGKG